MLTCPNSETSGLDNFLNLFLDSTPENSFHISYPDTQNQAKTFNAILVDDQYVATGQSPQLIDTPNVADIYLRETKNSCTGYTHILHFIAPYKVPRSQNFIDSCGYWEINGLLPVLDCYPAFDSEAFEKAVADEVKSRQVHGIENLEVETQVTVTSEKLKSPWEFSFIVADKGESEATSEELAAAHEAMDTARKHAEESKKQEIIKEYDMCHPPIQDPKPDPSPRWELSLGGLWGASIEQNSFWGSRLALTKKLNDPEPFIDETSSQHSSGVTVAYARDMTHRRHNFELGAERALLFQQFIGEGGAVFSFAGDTTDHHDKAVGIQMGLRILLDPNPDKPGLSPYLRLSGQVGWGWPTIPNENGHLVGGPEVGIRIIL